jgi:hypothetical protein
MKELVLVYYAAIVVATWAFWRSSYQSSPGLPPLSAAWPSSRLTCQRATVRSAGSYASIVTACDCASATRRIQPLPKVANVGSDL